MGTVMKASEFVKKLIDVEKYKTLYIMGCFGAPLTKSNKSRYTRNHEYNRDTVRTVMINSASSDTFGFDCVNLLKAVLWGWTGDPDKVYGGSRYVANGVPDIGADTMFKRCSDISTDFTTIKVGEAVWMPGHIGVYIGGGLTIECTPKWKNGVQFTACNATKVGYNRRNWTKHGKLPWIEYDVEDDTGNDIKPPYRLEDFVRDIQGAIGAKVDGIAGNETLTKTVTLSAVLNRKHPAVYYVQRRLQALGYTEVGKIDGIAGGKFTKAVKHFQSDNKCRSDGEITARAKTWLKLLGMI